MLKINQACDIVQARCWQWDRKTVVCLNVYLKKEKGKIIIVVRKQCVRCLCLTQCHAAALVEQSRRGNAEGHGSRHRYSF